MTSTFLQSDTEREEHAIPDHQDCRRHAGVPGGEDDVADHQNQERGREDHEVTAGQEVPSRRCRPRTGTPGSARW